VGDPYRRVGDQARKVGSTLIVCDGVQTEDASV